MEAEQWHVQENEFKLVVGSRYGFPKSFGFV